MTNTNWQYLPLNEAAEICDNLRKPINSKERNERIAEKPVSELFPYYGATGQVGYIDDYITDGEYVLLGEDGAPFLSAFAEKAYIINGKTWVNNHAHILKSHTSNKFLCYFLNSFNYKGYVSGTTRLKLTQASMKQIMVPVPPLEDQHRIVTRIEELFSQLDSGVKTLKKTKEQLKVYRQAVLKEAFAFKLSNMIEIREIVDDIRIGPFGTMLHKSDYIDNGVPVINPQHIKNLTILESNKITVSNDKAKELSAYRLKCNDIIMGRRGEMGRTAAITEREDGWICGTGSILFRLKPDYDAVFFAQILSSPDVIHYLEAKATGTTMKNLNEEIVKHIPVPNITKHEQQKITNMLDSKLSVCDSIEKTIDTALQEAEALRQSILKQAFEGGL